MDDGRSVAKCRAPCVLHCMIVATVRPARVLASDARYTTEDPIVPCNWPASIGISSDGWCSDLNQINMHEYVELRRTPRPYVRVDLRSTAGDGTAHIHAWLDVGSNPRASTKAAPTR